MTRKPYHCTNGCIYGGSTTIYNQRERMNQSAMPPYERRDDTNATTTRAHLTTTMHNSGAYIDPANGDSRHQHERKTHQRCMRDGFCTHRTGFVYELPPPLNKPPPPWPTTDVSNDHNDERINRAYEVQKPTSCPFEYKDPVNFVRPLH